MEFNHIPVLKDSCIKGLNIRQGGIYVDGTLGGAGHSAVILENLKGSGKLIGIDRDNEALAVASKRLSSYTNFIAVHDNHVNILNILSNLNISGVDGILLDLGVSSYQLDEKSRGFSYMQDAPLDMRMNKEDNLTAEYVVNNYSEEELSRIFFDYGEEKFSTSIARGIVKAREEKKITTTLELVDIIEKNIPKKALQGKGHPAKRVFQAIRIEVNSEIKLLEKGIEDCIKALNKNGRLCVISFHSLEDRIVKNVFAKMQGKCTCPKDLPKCVCNYISYGKVITKKPILPTEEEMKINSRSKSAKLRIFERN